MRNIPLPPPPLNFMDVCNLVVKNELSASINYGLELDSVKFSTTKYDFDRTISYDEIFCKV